MKYFFIFLFVILFIQGAFAISFSPTNLVFELEFGEESCEMVKINSESEIVVVSDRWAETPDIDYSVGLFNFNSEDHGISISYPDQLSLDNRDVEVCLSGLNQGEYHGVLLFTEEQQGNSVIEAGIWLKVVIEESVEDSPSSSNTGGSGWGSTYQDNERKSEELVELEDVADLDFQDKDNVVAEVVGNNAEITGGVIGTNKYLFKWGAWVLLIIVVIACYFFYRWKKDD